MADIPKIRFKGFTEPWEQRKLGDLLNETREKTSVEDEDTLLSCAIDGMFLNSELFSHFRGSSNIGYLKVKKNDLILSAQNLHLGNCNVNLRFEHGIISPAYKVYELINCDPLFMQAWVKQDKTKDFFLKASTEGASICRKNIVWEELYKQELPVPKINEQVKIGAFFQNLDNLITLHQRKCDDTKELKKYMLQKMFPKNGEKFPEIRFKGFTEAWEQRKLGEVLKERTERAKGDEELLSVTIANGVIRQIDSEKRNTASEDRSNYKIVKKGDVPYNSMRMWQGAVGNSKYNGIVSPAYTILTPTPEANGKFFMELFKKKSTLQIFQRWSQGLTSDTWNLKYPILSSIQFAIPSVEEQEKIAEYFSSLDHLITLHQRKCDTLKELKKYMLQNMFPKKG